MSASNDWRLTLYIPGAPWSKPLTIEEEDAWEAWAMERARVRAPRLANHWTFGCKGCGADFDDGMGGCATHPQK